LVSSPARTLLAALMSATLSLLLLIGCSGTAPKDDAEDEGPFRIVGYVTAGAVLDVIDVSKLTHINYAFLLPMKNGELKPFGSSAQLRRVVARAAESDVKVLISAAPGLLPGWLILYLSINSTVQILIGSIQTLAHQVPTLFL